jgi:hypothetical protein
MKDKTDEVIRLEKERDAMEHALLLYVPERIAEIKAMQSELLEDFDNLDELLI